ncbi:CPBP family intramembrane glutamic endopeptidase [Clostridium akagii]|uniref:CPBP family intramembrane glutamic endopeptidase n=1 Tax=Clostridium akagii TaxID=91623 RepID=UPI0004790987|nr:CPBP family intramembrane glutamic endopeptidase [Clostridium akagii]
MKHIKVAAIILVYLVIYYGFQLVDFLFIGVQAAFKGIKGADLTKYLNDNSATVMIPAMIISFLIYFVILKARQKSILKICKINKIKTKSVFFIIGITATYALVLITISQYTIKYFPSYNETQNSISGTMSSVLGIVAVLILAPIFEEILFRGIILSEIRENLRVIPAVIIQAVIFGIYHMNIFQGIYTAVLGLILGYVCVRTMTILSSIIAHITFNVCGSFVFPILVYYVPQFSIAYIVAGTILFCLLMFNFNRSTKNEIRSIEKTNNQVC